MTFTTESGSVYEVNTQESKIRKLGGTSSAKRVSENWRPYIELLQIKVGDRAIIVWPNETEVLEKTKALIVLNPSLYKAEDFTKATLTTTITKIEED